VSARSPFFQCVQSVPSCQGPVVRVLVSWLRPSLLSWVEILDAEVAASKGGLLGRLYGERCDSDGGFVLWSFGWRGSGVGRSLS
jgi:hypothetical protein